MVTLMSDSEALEAVKFDPAVQPEDTWAAPSVMESFLAKHFNKSLSSEERKKIFPSHSVRPCKFLSLDDQLKENPKGRGKDPHYGSEKTLYVQGTGRAPCSHEAPGMSLG